MATAAQEHGGGDSSRRPPHQAVNYSIRDRDYDRARERTRQQQLLPSSSSSTTTAKSAPVDPAKEQEIMALTTRSGGAYIPPARLRELQSQIKDKSGEAYQRITWDALKKSINGLINKVNTANIKDIVVELFGENLIRGRGLLARSLIRAQHASPMFSPVYAALLAVINTKLPAVGALVLSRLIAGFQRAYRRNDKSHCLSITKFLAHLVNHQVSHEIVALQVLALLLERPTDDSVEVAVGFMREVGAFLSEASPKATHATFERFRTILSDSAIDKRVQYMIEVLFQVRKDKFKDNPIKPAELDLVEEEDQFTHFIGLDDELQVEDQLDVFRFDPAYEQNEEKYAEIKTEILGDSSDSEEGSSGSDADDDDRNGRDGDDKKADDDDGDEGERRNRDLAQLQQEMSIEDKTETNLVGLRRTVYLTIMSSLDHEECCHKLMKMNLKPGQEIHLCSMVVECCSQERSYEKYYGLIAERLCRLNRVWTESFATEFRNLFQTIHRFETNRIRNIAKLYAHLLYKDALSWTVLDVVRLSEEDTTSSSRIFLKILFQEISEAIGVKELNKRLQDPYMQESFSGLFPKDNPRHLRFAINYFTSVGLAVLTQDMRDYLKSLPQLLAIKPEGETEQLTSSSPSSDNDGDDDDDKSSKSSYTGSSYSSSSASSRSMASSYSSSLSGSGRRSRSPAGRRRYRSGRSSGGDTSKSRSRSPHSFPPAKRRANSPRNRSLSRSRSPVVQVKRRTGSPPRGRNRSLSRSRSPVQVKRRTNSPPRGRAMSQGVRRYRSPSRSRSPADVRRHSPPRSPPRRKRSMARSNSRSPSVDRRRRNYSRDRYESNRRYSNDGNRSMQYRRTNRRSPSPKRGRRY